MASNLQDLEPLLADWHRRRYGDRPVDLPRTVLKATEELGELARAVLKGDTANALEEAADVCICLFHVARGLGESLSEAVAAKLKVIEKRLTKKETSK